MGKALGRGSLAILACAMAVAFLGPTTPASAATCADFSNQAAAQAAANTRDADGDGIYCESLPCPCAKGGSGGGGGGSTTKPKTTKTKSKAKSCSRPKKVQRIKFSATKYPNITAHTNAAIAKGWPRVMVLNRKGASERRDRLLEDIPTLDGFDRDEYPAAVGRGKRNGKSRGLVRGSDPPGWMADVQYVPSAENRSHGSSLGAKLRKFCNGTRFRYVFN